MPLTEKNCTNPEFWKLYQILNSQVTRIDLSAIFYYSKFSVVNNVNLPNKLNN